MNGEITANQRLASRAVQDNSAARKGATIAFNHTQRTSPNVNSQPSAAAAAAVASTMNHHAELHRQEPDSEPAPEVGTVKDKIGRWNTNSLSPANISNRGRTPSLSLPPAPEQIAARLAASRSPERKEETTSAAAAAAKLGAIRSASRVQSQASTDRRELRSPTPIRPSYTRDAPLESMLQGDAASSDPDPSIEHTSSQRSRAGSIRDQAPSPNPSVSSRLSSAPSGELKPKLPPRSADPSQGPFRRPAPIGPGLRASTPSMASISGQSHNSNSSTVDDSGSMTEEALSNAIVASSLASARASPVTKVPPPPPQRRRARSRSLLNFTHSPQSDLSRTPSPPKGMPQTLRGIPKADEADAHRRHRLIRKHPHKHHEGDRRRWRQEITEKERKRYEGVWASNKGQLIPPGRGSVRSPNGTEKWPPPSEMVLNLIVREIWTRSRLPPAVLEQVWNLVDHRQIGLLTKEEFVVGMWLIDQQLKGRKLPVQVPESVWDSVRYVTGIKLSSAGRAHA